MTGPIIVIPTYNERESIQSLVPRVLRALPGCRVVVVDDNSPDGTGGVVREMAGREPRVELFPRAAKEGLGPAYRQALDVVRRRGTSVIVMMDADGSHDPDALPRLVARLDQADLVVGSRYVAGGGVENWPVHRRWLSRYGNLYARMVTGLPVRDCTAGFMAFRHELLMKLDLGRIVSNGYAFLIEIKAAAARMGARLAEEPIRFVEREAGRSKLSGHIIREAVIGVWGIRFR